MTKYDADSIPVPSSFAEAVRMRPQMYMGCDLDNEGLHTLVFYIAGSSAHPQQCNESTQLTLILEQDGRIVFEDDGRGIPAGRVASAGMGYGGPIFVESTDEKAKLIIHSVLTHVLDRHPTETYYKAFGFLDHLGCVMNALADDLLVETIVDGIRYKVRGRMAKITEPREMVGETSEKGTRIAFLPDYASFENAEFNRQMLEDGLQQLGEKYPHVAFRLVDNRVGFSEYEND